MSRHFSKAPAAVRRRLLATPEAGVLRAAFQWLRYGRSLKTLNQLFVLCFCVQVGFDLLLPRVRWYAPLIFLLPFAGFFAWLLFMGSVTVQNRPALARLVPGQVRALRRVLGAGALVLVVLAAPIGMMAGGFFGAPGAHVQVAMAATGAALLLTAWMDRLSVLPALFFFLWLDGAFDSTWFQAASGFLTRTVEANRVTAAVATALLLTAAWYASLRSLITPRGSRYRTTLQGLRALARLLGDRLPGRESWPRGRPGGKPAWSLTGLYHRQLDKACSERRGTALNRAVLGLSPFLHWTGLLGTALMAGAVSTVLPWMLSSGTGSVLSKAFVIQVVLPLLIVTFGSVSCLSAGTSLYRSRREQALLVLLPGMPRGGALNLDICRHLMARFLGTWCLGLVTVLTVVPASNAPLRAGLLAFVFAQLPCSAMLCRDWSVMRAPHLEQRALPILSFLAAPFFAAALQWRFGVSAWWCAAALTVFAIATVTPRWLRLKSLPAGWPTGRRAEQVP